MKNITLDEAIKDEDNILEIIKNQESIMRSGLEMYADKRFGIETEENIIFKEKLNDPNFFIRSMQALSEVSIFLYSVCYDSEITYEKKKSRFFNSTLSTEKSFKEIRAFLLKNHENISEVNELNEKQIAKYYKRVDEIELFLRNNNLFNL